MWYYLHGDVLLYDAFFLQIQFIVFVLLCLITIHDIPVLCKELKW